MKNNDTCEKLRQKGGLAVHLQIPLASGLEESWPSGLLQPPVCCTATVVHALENSLYNKGRKSEKVN